MTIATYGWIKFRTSLWSDGRIRRMSHELGTHRHTIIGCVVRLWSLADDHADDDGLLPHYTPDDIDEEVGLDGFCKALPADWCEITGEGIKLPDYHAHNGSTAKSRAQDAARKRKSRATNTCDSVSGKPVTTCHKNRGPEEKRIDKKISSSASAKQSRGNGKANTRKSNPLWDIVAELFFASGVSKADKTRIGKVVRDLEAKNATPKLVRARFERAKTEWEQAFGPEAVVKHWDQLEPLSSGRRKRKQLTLDGD